MDVRVPRVPSELGYVLVTAVALLIGFASLIEPSGMPTGWSLFGVASDKWFHGVGYAGLSGIIAYVCLPERGPTSGRALAAACLLALSYGFVIELFQVLLPYRTFSLTDLAANGAGSFLGPIPIAVVGRRWLQ